MRALLQPRIIAFAGVLFGACVDSVGPLTDGGTTPDAPNAPDAGLVLEAGVYLGEPMIHVPAGAFYKGCNPTSCPPEVTDCCLPHELPQHEVTTAAFSIDRTETTVATYRACVEAGRCPRPMASDPRCNFDHAGRETHPINCIDPIAAREVCAFQGKRLCSESEWEKAASGGCELYGATLCALSIPQYVHGARSLASDCGFVNHQEVFGRASGRGCGLDQTSEVHSRPLGRSPYGVLGLNGNASEITEDCFAPNYQGTPRDGSPNRSQTCPGGQAVRGGSFTSLIEASKTWARRPWSEAQSEPTCCGVRCCGSP